MKKRRQQNASSENTFANNDGAALFYSEALCNSLSKTTPSKASEDQVIIKREKLILEQVGAIERLTILDKKTNQFKMMFSKPNEVI